MKYNKNKQCIKTHIIPVIVMAILLLGLAYFWGYEKQGLIFCIVYFPIKVFIVLKEKQQVTHWQYLADVILFFLVLLFANRLVDNVPSPFTYIFYFANVFYIMKNARRRYRGAFGDTTSRGLSNANIYIDIVMCINTLLFFNYIFKERLILNTIVLSMFAVSLFFKRLLVLHS